MPRKTVCPHLLSRLRRSRDKKSGDLERLRGARGVRRLQHRKWLSENWSSEGQEEEGVRTRTVPVDVARKEPFSSFCFFLSHSIRNEACAGRAPHTRRQQARRRPPRHQQRVDDDERRRRASPFIHPGRQGRRPFRENPVT